MNAKPELTRYDWDHDDMVKQTPHGKGEFVKYADAANRIADLEAEIERLKAACLTAKEHIVGWRGWVERSGSIQVNQDAELYLMDKVLAQLDAVTKAR